MEWKLLELIDYKTKITPSIYAKYYFDLRQLFFEVVGDEYIKTQCMKPLTAIQMRKLQFKSSSSFFKINDKKEEVNEPKPKENDKKNSKKIKHKEKANSHDFKQEQIDLINSAFENGGDVGEIGKLKRIQKIKAMNKIQFMNLTVDDSGVTSKSLFVLS